MVTEMGLVGGSGGDLAGSSSDEESISNETEDGSVAGSTVEENTSAQDVHEV